MTDDLLIYDDYVVLHGQRMPRPELVSPQTWREDWEQMRPRLAARKSQAAINARMYDDTFDDYQRMLEG